MFFVFESLASSQFLSGKEGLLASTEMTIDLSRKSRICILSFVHRTQLNRKKKKLTQEGKMKLNQPLNSNR